MPNPFSNATTSTPQGNGSVTDQEVIDAIERTNNANLVTNLESTTLASFQNLSPSYLPRATSAGFANSLMSQDRFLSVGVDGDLMSTMAGLELGQGLTVVGDGSSVAFFDNVENRSTLPVGVLLNDDGTTGINCAIRRHSLVEGEVIQGAQDETFVGAWVAHLPVTAPSRIVKGLMVRLANAVTGVRLTMRQAVDNLDTEGDVLYQSHSDSDFAAGSGFSIPASPLGSPVNFPVNLGRSAKVIEGSLIYVVVEQNTQGTGVLELRGSTLAINGITQFYAYLEQSYVLESQDEIALKSDLASASSSANVSVGATDLPNHGPLATNQKEVNRAIDEALTTIANTQLNSGRAFTRFNDGFSITAANQAETKDKNNLYTARNDKVINVFLPDTGTVTDYFAEFSHLAGTIPRGSGTNLVRLVRFGGNPSLLVDNIATLHLDDVVFIQQNGNEWIVTRSILDPTSTLLPEGVFDLQVGVLADVSNIAALGTIEAGEAWIVGTGNVSIEEGDVIVALTGNPSTDISTDDWLVISDKQTRGLTIDEVAFFNHVTRSGDRFDANSRFFIDPANVIEFISLATGTPVSNAFLTPNSQNVETRDLGTFAIPFTELVGGSLTLNFEIRTAAQAGFEPEFREIKLNYGGSIFTFSTLNREIDVQQSITITIPNTDYSAAVNVNPTASIEYIERGAQWAGSVIINSVTNMLKGTLHDPVIDLIQGELMPVKASLSSSIAGNTALINTVKRTTDALSAKLDNPISSLPQATTSYLLNDIEVIQEDAVTRIPTPFNTDLNGGSAGLIVEANSPAPVQGKLTTDDFLSNDSKLIYVGASLADGATLIEAVNGGTTQVLMSRVGTNLTVNQFVPAHGGGSRTVTHYPSPTNQVGFAGRWFTLDLTSASHEPISSELFFTNDLPTTATSITVYSQILANGGVYNPVSRVFTFGGASDVTETFTEGTGAESVFVTVTYRAANRDIKVTAVPHVDSGLAIDDLQVRFEWSETITEASFTASSANIVVLPYVENTTVLVGIKPSAAGDIIIITTGGEIDTGYSYSTYLGALEVTAPMAMPFDALISLNQSLLVQLNNRVALPYFGLFTDDHKEETVLSLDTQLAVVDSAGTVLNVGNLLTQLLSGALELTASPNGTVVKLVADDTDINDIKLGLEEV